MAKVDPETGEMMPDDPDQQDEEMAGGEGSAQDPEREIGDDNPSEQGAAGH